MRLIEDLGRTLVWAIHKLFKPQDTYTPDADISEEPIVIETGQILNGRIYHIDDRHIVVRAHDTVFQIDKHQITKDRGVNLNNVFSLYENVEFAVLERNENGWFGSVLLPKVYRKREQLKSLRKRIFKADEINIKDYKYGNLILEYNNDIEIRIHSSELPVHIQKKNSVREIRSLIKDGSLKVKKTGMFPPKDQIYNYNETRNEAYLTGTIQNFEYISSEETVDILTHAYPFKIEVSAIRPHQLDNVTEFVLKAISTGKTAKDIIQITGLKEQIVEEICEKLEHLQYLKGGKLTHRAERFLRAIEQEEVINKNDFGGYFASAAHPMHEIITNDTNFERVNYGSTEVLPPKDREAWDNFSNKTDQDLSYSFLKSIVPEDQTDTLTKAVMSDLLRIFIRKARKPDVLFLVPTPVDWFYGGLLSHFSPLSTIPDIPENIEIPETYCDNYLLIQYDVTHTPAIAECDSENDGENIEIEEAEVIKNVFYETNTYTIWQLKDEQLHVIDINKSVSKLPIEKNYVVELPNGDRLDSFRNPQIKLITNL